MNNWNKKKSTKKNHESFDLNENSLVTECRKKLVLDDDYRYIVSEREENYIESKKLSKKIQDHLNGDNGLKSVLKDKYSKNDLIQTVLTFLQNYYRMERIYLLLWNDLSENYEIIEGRIKSGVSESIQLSRTLIKHVLKNRKSVFSKNIISDDRFKDSESLQGQKIQSIICSPIFHQKKLLGLFYFDSLNSYQVINEDDVDFLCLVSMEFAKSFKKVSEEYATQKKLLNKKLSLKNGQVFAGVGERTQSLIDQVFKISRTGSNVLIRGETGTGKELVSHLIHEHSPRSEKPFVIINCAGLNSEIIESELFGHEKGAFTSASYTKKGKLEVEDGGSVFFDEIGELPLKTQVKLFRYLDSGSFERVGGNQIISSKVRVIAATNRDLEKQIRENQFREELYFRLNVVSVCLPPLRERWDEFDHLVDYFVSYYAELFNFTIPHVTDSAFEKLKNHSWPGNVRELKFVIERAFNSFTNNRIQSDDIVFSEISPENHLKTDDFDYKKALKKFEF